MRWLDPALGAATHNVVIGRQAYQRPLATWAYKKIYDLRNDYLHGNEVAGPSLMLNNKPVIDFTGCLYRLLLTGFLSLEFNEPLPPPDDAEAMGEFVSRRMNFNKPQKLLETALLTSI